MMKVNRRTSICLLSAIRLASVFLVTTSYVPDEYWQSLEIAHKLAFGYGYTTWEWKVGIRSYLYPGLIAVLYKILAITRTDTVWNVIFLPRVCQALLSTCADIMFIRWCETYIGVSNNWALMNISSTWFHAYTATRTLTNSVEASLTTIALCLYPWTTKKKRSVEISAKYLWIVGLACLIRPTACVIWLPFAFYHFLQSNNWKLLSYLYFQKLVIFIAVSTVVDSLCHGAIACSTLSFLYYNIIKDIGSFYGTHGKMWYLTTGVPCVLGVHCFPFLLGCKEIIINKSVKARSVGILLIYAIAWTVFVYSLIPHKEFRFILPLVPMMMFIVTFWLTEWEKKTSSRCCLVVMKLFVAVGCILPFLYCGIIHQRGTIDVMRILENDLAKNPKNTSIWFLTPCHSTPLYSHLHHNVDTFFLECDPLASQDVADVFFYDPLFWLNTNFPETGKEPSHIVLFNTLHGKITGFLTERHYNLFIQLFHSHFAEGNVGTHIMIFKKSVDS